MTKKQKTQNIISYLRLVKNKEIPIYPVKLITSTGKDGETGALVHHGGTVKWHSSCGKG